MITVPNGRQYVDRSQRGYFHSDWYLWQMEKWDVLILMICPCQWIACLPSFSSTSLSHTYWFPDAHSPAVKTIVVLNNFRTWKFRALRLSIACAIYTNTQRFPCACYVAVLLLLTVITIDQCPLELDVLSWPLTSIGPRNLILFLQILWCIDLNRSINLYFSIGQ